MMQMFETEKFTDVWDSAEAFKEDVKGSPLNKLKDSSIETLFYLMYAKYGNSPIANYDAEQFKFKVYSIIFTHGPTWERRVEIQDIIRNMSEDDLRAGSVIISNHAFNPGNAPSTASQDEIIGVNDQSSNKTKRSKLNAYAMLWDVLKTDVTTQFIERFKICFKQFVMPERPVLYESED